MAEKVALFFHLLSALWLAAGLAAVLVPLIRAYNARQVEVQALAIEEASHYQGVLLVPGAVAAGATGVFYWAARGQDVFRDPMLLALGLLYLVVLLLFLPLAGLGLRRLRLAAFQARRGQGHPLEEALAERVALVFLALAVLTLPALVAISLAAA